MLVQIPGDSRKAGDLKEDMVTTTPEIGNLIADAAAAAAQSETPAPAATPTKEPSPAAQTSGGAGAGGSGDGEPTVEQLKAENAALKKSAEDERARRIGIQRQVERDQATNDLREEVAGLKKTLKTFASETARGATPEELTAALATADEETAKTTEQSRFERLHDTASEELRGVLMDGNGNFVVDTSTLEFQALSGAWDKAVETEDRAGMLGVVSSAKSLALIAARQSWPPPEDGEGSGNDGGDGEGAKPKPAAKGPGNPAMRMATPKGGPTGEDQSWRELSAEQQVIQGHREAQEAAATTP